MQESTTKQSTTTSTSTTLVTQKAVTNIQHILKCTKSYKRYPIITFGQQILSPYTLTCNGFVNRDFAQDEQQQQQQQQQGHLRQGSFSMGIFSKPLIIICHYPECQKTVTLNNTSKDGADGNFLDGADYQRPSKEQLMNLLSEHEQKCPLYKKGFQKLSQRQLYLSSKALHESIRNTYFNSSSQKQQITQKEELLNKITINWQIVNSLICYAHVRYDQDREQLQSSQQNKRNSFNFRTHQYYQVVDTHFSVERRQISNSILLPLFGWKLTNIGAQKAVFRCHFCHVKEQLSLISSNSNSDSKQNNEEGENKSTKTKNNASFNFYKTHRQWCLIVANQMWKVMLHTLWLEEKSRHNRQYQLGNNGINTGQVKDHESFPKTKQQIQVKQLRKELYESVIKTAIQKINDLERSSRGFSIKKEIGKGNEKPCQDQDQNKNNNNVVEEAQKGNDIISTKVQKLYDEKIGDLMKIGQESKRIMKEFIDSIKI